MEIKKMTELEIKMLIRDEYFKRGCPEIGTIEFREICDYASEFVDDPELVVIQISETVDNASIALFKKCVEGSNEAL